MLYLKFALFSVVVAAVAFFWTPSTLGQYFSHKQKPAWSIRKRFSLWKPVRCVTVLAALLASNLVFALTNGHFAGPAILLLAMAVLVGLDVRQLDTIAAGLDKPASR